MTTTSPLILASTSQARARMLSQAGVPFVAEAARIDEDAVRASFLKDEGLPGTARDLSDLLAELKAEKVSRRFAGALVIGADQVLECDGRIHAKPDSPDIAREQIARLSGRTHHLFSACVVVRDGTPLWRHVGKARLTMHALGEAEIERYVDQHWPAIRHCVGCYRIEAEGVRLFSRIEGDFFHVLGLPLIELLTWLRIRGDIAP
jgi:septum formation protein